ncbi:aminotransferase class I/II-fold pyridoxal phosphate-dependent enzyme [Sporosarcina sp. HYO08]|uniref:aminotransferase class I/II-fold pyridoxal phosphate-dependent enzyme n=1 Tax=Sporosarcina sp. HYO08 TaxID=1759557 RepID=UPI0007998224|nr:aminotransferase class I/II-fold pyridoxal phosphate-dependent enzyme [Sporosarcina sp. HYO08]KXH86850.1 lysine decarboxylase [Sporosarcina sp. HYO08]
MQRFKRPLIEAMIQLKETNSISFHVPGHKNGMISNLPLDFQLALRYDFTELEGLDDLHEPAGVIAEAEQKLADLYGAEQSFFLVNGSTVGNLAMIYATCQKGDTVIVQRNAHKSIFHALELTGADPVFVSPAWDSKKMAASMVASTDIQQAIEEYPTAKAVILTYPTYYGQTGTDLQKIIKLAHAANIPVLVDEAHGAHFVVGTAFPTSALALGADVVVHSAHKTLPAMTQASFLHIRSKLISAEKIMHYLQMLQSSSPSYLLMASLDDARAYAEAYTIEDQQYFMKERMRFIEQLQGVSKLEVVESDDPLKLLLRIEGYSGFNLQKQLEKTGVFTELADPYQVLLVLPLLKLNAENRFHEAGEKIKLAVAAITRNERTQFEVLPSIDQGISRLTIGFSQLHDMEKEWIHYESAVGRIAAGSIIPYPPGIPLVIAGEQVTVAHVQALRQYLQMRAKFQGAIEVDQSKIFVVKERTEE